MQEYTDIEAQVEFAASKIDSERRVEISLRDLMFVFRTVGELIRVFHWPDDVQKGFDDGHFDNPNPPYYYEEKCDLQGGEKSM